MLHKRFFALVFLLSLSFPLSAQYALTDSLGISYEKNQIDGQKLLKNGRTALISGGVLTGLGAAMIVTPLIIHDSNPAPEGEFREDMGSAILLSFGAGFLFTGAIGLIVSVPYFVSGNGILNAEDYWKDLRYDNKQEGFGYIIDAAGFIPWIQARATAGWHFNKNFFLGGGAAFALDFAEVGNEYSSMYDLPVFADLRYSMLNRYYSPFIGLSIGYDILNPSPYTSADIGLRVRLSPASPRSFWASVTGEVAAYMRIGLKLGYSF